MDIQQQAETEENDVLKIFRDPLSTQEDQISFLQELSEAYLQVFEDSPAHSDEEGFREDTNFYEVMSRAAEVAGIKPLAKNATMEELTQFFASVVNGLKQKAEAQSRARARADRPATTPVPRRLAQQTAQEIRVASTAICDAPTLLRWIGVEGQIALMHRIDGQPLQTIISAGKSLDWWGLPSTHDGLRDLLQHLGLESVFLLNVLIGLALKEGQVTISIDELIRLVGKGEEARRGVEFRQKAAQAIWRSLMLFDALAIVGQRGGNYTTRDTKEKISMDTTAVESMIKITGYQLSQESFDKSTPPAFVSYVCGPWIEKMRGDRRILTDFGDILKIAAIPAGKASGAWAKTIGLGLNQRWREWSHAAEIAHVGDKNKPVVHFSRTFTRRDLLLGETLFRSNPDAEAMLNSDEPRRAKTYWDKAIDILKTERIISHYKEIGSLAAGRVRWRDEWLNQELDIRPNQQDTGAVVEIVKATKNARRGRQKPAVGKSA